MVPLCEPTAQLFTVLPLNKTSHYYTYTYAQTSRSKIQHKVLKNRNKNIVAAVLIPLVSL